jgi:hypothetical protein
MWKSEAIRNLSAVFFCRKTVVAKDEIPTEKLARIGQLTLGFKKKSGLVSISERVKMVDTQNK